MTLLEFIQGKEKELQKLNAKIQADDSDQGYEVVKNVYFKPDFEQKQVKCEDVQGSILDLRETAFFSPELRNNCQLLYLSVDDNALVFSNRELLGGTQYQWERIYIDGEAKERARAHRVDRFEEIKRQYLLELEYERVTPLIGAYTVDCDGEISDIASSTIRTMLEHQRIDGKQLWQSIYHDLQRHGATEDMEMMKYFKFIPNHQGFWQIILTHPKSGDETDLSLGKFISVL